MRKLLVFLLLLGAGLLLLYWLDRQSREEIVPAPVEPPRPVPELAEETQGFQLGGPSQLTHYDETTKRLLYRVRSEDTRTEGGFDILTGVTVELFDPEGEDVLLVRLWADRASPRRLASDGFQPNWEERLELEGVRADILGGIPLAPLSFETPRAVIDLTDENSRRIGGEEAFEATSAELELEGRGFDWSLDTQELLIRHAGRVEILRPGSEAASLTARGDGSLRMFRPDGPEGPITLEAAEGAVLEPGAENPGRLEADHVTLRAAESDGPDSTLFIEQLVARGNVDWTSGEARFQGKHLTAGFRPDGQLDRARLDGEPRAELTLVLSGGVLPPTEAPEERLVVLDGQDSLDITWQDDGYTLHLESEPPDPNSMEPARVPTVTTRDFRLKSASTIDGWLARDQRSARFKASGGVLVTSGSATLETAEFEVEIGVGDDGQTTLVGTASGGARLTGELPPEEGSESAPRDFALTSPEGLKIERNANGWRVIESTNVDVTLADPQGFHASAGRVTDFVVPRTDDDELTAEGVRFRAEENVRVDFAQGRFGGNELDVMGVAPVPHFVLRGDEESKAFLEVEYGEASALEIEVTGETLQARGNVTGSAEFSTSDTPDGVRTTFAGDALTLDRNESPELLPGERLRILRVLVEGNAKCSVDAEDQTLVVTSRSFSAENRVRLVEGADGPVELGSLFLSEGNVHADFLTQGSDLSVDCDRFEVERTASDLERGFRQLIASGNVRFQGRSVGAQTMSVGGEGEVLVFDSSRRGSLEAAPNSRVILRGVAPKSRTPFRLSADRVDFELSEDEILHLIALRPELRMLGLRARAEHLTADDQQGVRLSGGVRASGATSSHVPFTLDAEDISLVGRRLANTSEEGEQANAEDQLDALSARGKVDFRLSNGARARGERLVVKRATGLLRLEGAPASFEFGPTRLETEWVEFDPVLELLVATGPGRLLQVEEPGARADEGSWTLDFLSVSTLLELDSVVLVIQEPLFRAAKFQSALRASWAILWLNREGFQDSERRSELLRALQESFDSLKTLPSNSTPLDKITMLRSTELAGLLREVYFEGPVELLSEGELAARADAVYLDVASQHGWLARATIHMGGQFMGQRQEKLVIKTDWMRLSSDASLRADRATVTACGFDEPHVRVVTGDLKIEPVRGPGKEHYQIRLKDNRVELFDFLKIPLPTIDVATDDELKPILPSLSLANSARFGTLFGFAFTRPADGLGRAFDSVARPDGGDGEGDPAEPGGFRSEVDAHYKIDASYLGSRGGLLDLGVEIEAKEDYWFDLYAGVVVDRGEDRGFVRVPEEDRDTVRRWLRSRAYFDLGKSAWTFSYSDQSDAGVQSEFFEGDFLRYERAETYLQWRRSDDEYFVQGTAKVRIDSFRSNVEELPSLSGYRGRSPLFSMGPLSLIHTGDIRAEYLRRRTGTEPHSPFEESPTFQDPVSEGFGTLDGLGDREVLRFDTTQSIEMPIPIGAGWKLTPFISGRATAWSEGIDEGDEPERFLAQAGARLGTTFWKRAQNGKLHQFAPFVEYSSELAREDEGGESVIFDNVDRVLTGDFIRIGSRARFGADQENSLLDIDLIGTYASERSDGVSDGWMPIEVFGRLVVQPLGHEFEIFHDARYDFEKSETPYSLLSLGTHFGEEWGVQAVHQRGRDQEGEALFETASLSGLYRWSEKWEFEGRQSFSLLLDEGLDSKILVRRYGHDIVFEFEGGVREGEGTSFGISLKPRFRFRPPRVGYVPW